METCAWRPGPSFRALLFSAGFVRLSWLCCFGVCSAAVLGWTWSELAGSEARGFGLDLAGLGWKRVAFVASILVGSGGNVFEFGHVPAGSVHASRLRVERQLDIPAVTAAAFACGGAMLRRNSPTWFLATLGSGDMCLQPWFVLQGPAVLAFVVLLFWARLG